MDDILTDDEFKSLSQSVRELYAEMQSKGMVPDRVRRDISNNLVEMIACPNQVRVLQPTDLGIAKRVVLGRWQVPSTNSNHFHVHVSMKETDESTQASRSESAQQRAAIERELREIVQSWTRDSKQALSTALADSGISVDVTMNLDGEFDIDPSTYSNAESVSGLVSRLKAGKTQAVLEQPVASRVIREATEYVSDTTNKLISTASGSVDASLNISLTKHPPPPPLQTPVGSRGWREIKQYVSGTSLGRVLGMHESYLGRIEQFWFIPTPRYKEGDANMPQSLQTLQAVNKSSARGQSSKDNMWSLNRQVDAIDRYNAAIVKLNRVLVQMKKLPQKWPVMGPGSVMTSSRYKTPPAMEKKLADTERSRNSIVDKWLCITMGKACADVADAEVSGSFTAEVNMHTLAQSVRTEDGRFNAMTHNRSFSGDPFISQLITDAANRAVLLQINEEVVQFVQEQSEEATHIDVMSTEIHQIQVKLEAKFNEEQQRIVREYDNRPRAKRDDKKVDAERDAKIAETRQQTENDIVKGQAQFLQEFKDKWKDADAQHLDGVARPGSILPDVASIGDEHARYVDDMVDQIHKRSMISPDQQRIDDEQIVRKFESRAGKSGGLTKDPTPSARRKLLAAAAGQKGAVISSPILQSTSVALPATVATPTTAHASIAGDWTKAWDSSTQGEYWYNSKTGVSQWERPNV